MFESGKMNSDIFFLDPDRGMECLEEALRLYSWKDMHCGRWHLSSTLILPEPALVELTLLYSYVRHVVVAREATYWSYD